ncbi:MAG: site-specific recombinase resolvase [Tabrizicola sp.]
MAADDRHVHDVTLLDGVACAFYWQHLLDSGAMPSGSAIARAEGLHHSVVNELLRLTLLAPDIVEMLLAGRQPRRMSLIWFQRHPLPVDWVAQREIVRRFEEAA